MNQPPSLHKALAGDRQALEQLAADCHRAVFGYLVRMTGSRERAADLAQDTVLSMLQSLDAWRPRPGAGFLSWVFRIARNRMIDESRKRREEPLPEGDGWAATACDACDDTIRRAEAAGLMAALDRLPPADKELMLFRWFHGLSHREIAAILSVKPAIVKSRLNAALTRLRKQYSSLEGEGPNAKTNQTRA